MISISIGPVYIVTRQTGSFSPQREKREHVAILSGDAYKGKKKKKELQFRDGTNDQTADFCFGNGRINKPFATTTAG